MNHSVFRMTLDIHDAASQTAVVIKNEDTVRRLSITLSDGGRPYMISDECTAVFTAEKPDGHIVFNDCEIDGNTIHYNITPQTTAVVGVVPCEIRLYGANDALLTSPQFTLVVSETIYHDGVEVESATEVTTLTHLISEATKAIHEAEQAIEDLDSKQVELDGKVAEAKASAESAWSSEENAKSSEDNAKAAQTKAEAAAQTLNNASINAAGHLVLIAPDGTVRDLGDVTGDDGSSIQSITRTAGNGAPGTTDTYTVTLTDGRTTTFQVYNGKDGEDGVSPSISAAAITGGHRLSITDASGSKTVDVMDGGNGDDGVSPTVNVEAITGGHRITITDATGTKTVDVMDGKDGASGDGAGDMLASDYDPQGKKQDVFAYADAVQGNLNTHDGNTTKHITAAERTAWNNKSNFSGNYNDLSNKPTIPTVPSNVSAFTNDAGYLTEGDVSAVKYIVQNLTEEQKAQARENIGALSRAEWEASLLANATIE